MRLDLAVSSKLGISRNRAQRLIDEGVVSVDGKICSKPSFEVEGETIEVSEGSSNHWVARSAGKLDGFLEELSVISFQLREGNKTQNSKQETENSVCLDIGSSTGGFIQILLER